MTDEDFEKLVALGIATLPEWVKEKIVNVAFLIEDEPTPTQRREHSLAHEESLFGLYEGVPQSERGDEAIILPDTITIFKKPILETYTREEDIRSCIENTIWHEVAHYFGYGEEWVVAEEQKRGKVL